MTVTTSEDRIVSKREYYALHNLNNYQRISHQPNNFQSDSLLERSETTSNSHVVQQLLLLTKCDRYCKMRQVL